MAKATMAAMRAAAGLKEEAEDGGGRAVAVLQLFVLQK